MNKVSFGGHFVFVVRVGLENPLFDPSGISAADILRQTNVQTVTSLFRIFVQSARVLSICIEVG